MSRRLHLGCGLVTPKGWVNVDGSWNASLAKWPRFRRCLGFLGLVPAAQIKIPWSPSVIVHDVRLGLPFPDRSFEAIYASHLFEHLHRDEAGRLTRECLRVLVPGGVLRLVVPDLRSIVELYLHQRNIFGKGAGDDKGSPAELLCKQLGMHPREAPRNGLIYGLYSAFKGFHMHKWMYDADSLSILLEVEGFHDVREMGFRESRIAEIGDVEIAGRILNGAGVCVEGLR